jgi:hypothetical protein
MSTDISHIRVHNLLKKILEANGSTGKIKTIFEKYFPEAFKKSEPAKKTIKQDTHKESEPEKKSKEKKIVTSGFVIKTVTNDLKFPTSKYKKEIPIEAAQSACKAIIKKNNLKNDCSFSFSIQENGGNKYNYHVKNGILTRNGRESNDTSDTVENSENNLC